MSLTQREGLKSFASFINGPDNIIYIELGNGKRLISEKFQILHRYLGYEFFVQIICKYWCKIRFRNSAVIF